MEYFDKNSFLLVKRVKLNFLFLFISCLDKLKFRNNIFFYKHKVSPYKKYKPRYCKADSSLDGYGIIHSALPAAVLYGTGSSHNALKPRIKHKNNGCNYSRYSYNQ